MAVEALARTTLLVITWMTLAFLPVYTYLHLSIGGSPFDVTNVVLQTLFYVLLQLWLFQFSKVALVFQKKA